MDQKSAPLHSFNKQSTKQCFSLILCIQMKFKIRSVRSGGKNTPHHKQSTPPHHHHTTPKTKLRFKLYFINKLQIVYLLFIVWPFVIVSIDTCIHA
jgi:hypothetical protein